MIILRDKEGLLLKLQKQKQISQNSQEKTCARASFLIKMQATSLKKETLA